MVYCIYNIGVDCYDNPRYCYKCGWNPGCASERSARIRQAIEEEAKKRYARKLSRIRRTAVR